MDIHRGLGLRETDSEKEIESRRPKERVKNKKTKFWASVAQMQYCQHFAQTRVSVPRKQDSMGFSSCLPHQHN